LNRKRLPGEKYTEGFPKTLDLFGQERHTELGHHHIELSGGKRQIEDICPLPMKTHRCQIELRNATIGWLRPVAAMLTSGGPMHASPRATIPVPAICTSLHSR
jgi:hypothetical protein